ncbi:uncharacterized protein Dwil_GK28184 [Drosophila willistoni]|uniref:Reverse transcriptase zinc-binding domain-containing protein n=1 Tax=Drosophila willistoni TaxID=7260 RepID=A0A0Q9WRU0_DROWI|nr:uncharacterized protein Dwil_GK28184 [Drosophila willistoni]
MVKQWLANSGLQLADHANIKAADIGRAINRILLNNRGPRQMQRLLLASVLRSVMLYGAPVWASAMEQPTYRRGMESTYRLTAVRVCRGFRTVSDEAALVIAGMTPIDLLAREAKFIFIRRQTVAWTQAEKSAAKAAARRASMEEWQRRWSTSTKGRWTHRLIPNLTDWLSRQSGEVTFELTQILSGHGCFRSYLHRFGKDSSPECTLCRNGMIEDPEHVIFSCPRFSAERLELEAILGRTPTVENLVPAMIESQEKWSAVCIYAANTMGTLRRLERLRNAGGA